MDNLIHKIKEDYGGFKKSFDINPHKHWKIIIKLFFVFSVLLIIFSLYIFYQINREQIFKIENVEPTKKNILKEKLLEEVEKSSKLKLENVEKVKSGLVNFSDPSK